MTAMPTGRNGFRSVSPTERVPFPSVVGAVVPLQLYSPPPLPQLALHMPLTPTGSISLGRVEASAV